MPLSQDLTVHDLFQIKPVFDATSGNTTALFFPILYRLL